MAAHHIALQPFDPNGPLHFRGWVDLFTNYCLLNNIAPEPMLNQNKFLAANNQRRALFLSLVGQRSYALLCSAMAPQSPMNLPIPVLINALLQRYDPPGQETTSRFSFHQRCQKPNESALDFISSLQTLAMSCNFGAAWDDSLRDRLVCGVLSHDTRKKLLNTVNLTFEQAKQILTNDEATERYARAIAQANPSVSACHVPSTTLRPKPKNDPQQQSAPATKSAGNTPTKTCFRCGSTDPSHCFRTCPAKSWTCAYCSKVGHAAKICQKKARDRGKSNPSASAVHPGTPSHSSTQPASQDPAQQPSTVNALPTPPAYQHPATSAQINPHIQQDVYIDNLLGFGVNMVNCAPVQAASPTLVKSAWLNGTPVAMEIDSASAFSIMSLSQFSRLFPGAVLTKSDLTLNSISGPLQISGEFPVAFSWSCPPARSFNLRLVVIHSAPEFTPLLGRNWLDTISPQWRGQMLSNAVSAITASDVPPTLDSLIASSTYMV